MPIRKVDGFHFHPDSRERVLAQRPADPAKTPWAPMRRPLADCRVTLVSTAGVFLKSDRPFDYERERREGTWGDPTHREIPRTAGQDDAFYSHLHVDTSFMAEDRNVAWPVDVFLGFEREGRIGALADTIYSIMGYIPNFNPLVKRTAPLMIEKMKAEGVEAAFLYPV